MKPVLTEALERLPNSTTKADIEFYWRIILEKFMEHEDEIISFLAGLNPTYEEEMYVVLRKMPELSARIAVRLWRHLNDSITGGGTYDVAHKRFRRLPLDEQLAIIEENLANDPCDSDIHFLASLLKLSRFTGPAKVVAGHLKKLDPDKIPLETLKMFVFVAKSIQSGTLV